MPTQNTGYSRKSKITINKIISGVSNITDHFIYNEFNSYPSITLNNLLTLSVSDYNNRVLAFKIYLEGIYPNLTLNFTDCVLRYINVDCGVDTVNYAVDFIEHQCQLYDPLNTQTPTPTPTPTPIPPTPTLPPPVVTPPVIPVCKNYRLEYYNKQNNEQEAVFNVLYSNNTTGVIVVQYNKFEIVRNVYVVEIANTGGEIIELGICGSLFELVVNGDGNGVESGSGFFNSGSTAQITAVPNEGYSFVRWEYCDNEGVGFSTNLSETILMNSDKCVKAIYNTVAIIYFNNIFDRSNIDHINDGSDNTNIFPLILGYPDKTDMENNVSTSNVGIRGKYNTDAKINSFYNTDSVEQLTEHFLKTNIGITGVTGFTSNGVVFKIRVTTTIGSENSFTEDYFYNKDGVTKKGRLMTKVETLGSDSIVAATAYNATNGVTTNSIVDNLIGSNQPIKLDYSGKNIWSNGGTTAANIMAGFAGFIVMIQVADLIWDWAEENRQPDSGVRGYFRSTRGLYNNESIKESIIEAKIINGTNLGFGNVNTPLLTQELDLNYINNISVEQINFNFKPRGDQFDVSVPPPLVSYLVELIPISGCSLSTTKPVAFRFMVAPDKFAQPKFDILPTYNWHYGSNAIFKDAKYCDYIVLLDKDKDSGVFLGLFGKYYHFYLGTYGGGLPEFNKDTNEINQKNYTIPISNLFSVPIAGYGSKPNYGKYQVIFANEKNQQLVMNHKFIDRFDLETNDELFIKKYWILGNGWKIGNGNAKKSPNFESRIYQELTSILYSNPNVGRKKHRVVIDCIVNSGDGFYIDCDQTFDANIWVDPNGNPCTINGNNTISYNGSIIDGILVNRTEKRIYIKKSMKFDYFLTSDNTSNNGSTVKDSKIKIWGLYNTDGYITECTVRYLVNAEAYKSSRLIPLKSYDINVIDDYLENILHLVYKYDGTPDFNNPNVSISFSVPKFINNSGLLFEWGDDSFSYYNFLSGFPTSGTISHIYNTFSPLSGGSKFVILVKMRYLNTFSELTCNSSGLVAIVDDSSTLSGAKLDLSNTNFGFRLNITDIQENPVSIRTTDDSNIEFFGLSTLKSLNLSNCKFLKFNLNNITFNVIEDINLSSTYIDSNVQPILTNVVLRDNIIVNSLINTPYTKIYGDLSNLVDTKKSINLNGSYVNSYTSNDNLTCKNITWTNHASGFEPTEFDLNRLIFDLNNSNVNNGTLNISGNSNPPITDIDTLTYINSLISKGWVVQYNVGYKLTVQNGIGSGYYKHGDIVNIIANTIVGHDFINWIGDIITIDNVNSNNTLITIGNNSLTINATYVI